MEVRDFTGSFLIDGRETEEMDLRVILSTGGGVTSGSGSFPVPAALAGRVMEGPLTFRTSAGDEITVLVRDFILTEGRAYFLTSGRVPQTAGSGTARSA
ncbi:hypothetical protein [Sinisalibacter aestuarii]|uniref:Uncharacterized protein n=1 Tax=Sinisalibacter aestuarii TaxID=2949426 RepID=A0ABQ5LX36_9RHOB|nr:hypothetical protein [Sinisalibacter aestuarii]GKY88960.1 hypothetical protein STA1M1_28290 [Sinisalibacter aestuarii]